MPDLSLLRQQWPSAVLSHMVWLQQELEGMRVEAKQQFRQTRLNSCIYCGTWIKCDMYRHVASFTWTWHNFGGVQCLGTQCGKARHKIVWIMFGGRMLSGGKLSWPALSSFFRRGQFDVRCGRIP